MARKNECIAMLLAGGQGSRLGILTHKIAKPAVPFGGKYRIIDFPLSNCVNSGIYTVGVLTQYQPLELNDYVGNGEPWDLDRTDGGVHILHEVASDGVSELMEERINALDDENYAQYLRFHSYICEKPEFLGASNHLLFVGEK